jgi:hypothetical protein
LDQLPQAWISFHKLGSASTSLDQLPFDESITQPDSLERWGRRVTMTSLT